MSHAICLKIDKIGVFFAVKIKNCPKMKFLVKYSFDVQFSIKLAFIRYVTWHISENHPNLHFLALKKSKSQKMTQNQIFGQIFFCCWIIHKISFHLICHMTYIWKSPKIAFLGFKKIKKSKTGPKWHFWSNIFLLLNSP